MEQIKLFEAKFGNIIATKISAVQLETLLDTEDAKLNPEWLAENSLACSYCRVEFTDGVQQRDHYKLDWHRYNLKQSLLLRPPISEEQFTERTDDISSIEGSDSEKEDTLDNIATAQGKIFLKNEANVVFSLYKCLLVERKVDLDELKISEQLRAVFANQKWGVLMLGGGHFAGGVFQGEAPIVHKTFHCYTVRAGQGGSQSSKDNRNASSAPKSAGASLRRYNENALVQHVKDIVELWKSEIDACSLIFYRAAGPYNRSILFGGKTPLLERSDGRLRTIPFSTRRATFTELKRVHALVSSVFIYDSLDNATQQFSKHVSPENEARRSKIKTSNINRAKSREIIERPLPTNVSSSSCSSNEDLLHELIDLEVSFTEELQPFEDTLTPEQRKQSKKKKSGKKSKNQKLRDIEIARKAELCNLIKAGDLDQLLNIFKASPNPPNDLINEVIDDLGNNLLHLATLHEKNDLIIYLLENGGNVCAKNSKQQTPYSCTQNKETRAIFKEFAIKNPDKFNYNKANIPMPNNELNVEEIAERKRLQRKAKRDKEKEKKKEKVIESHEKAEKDRFLNLSDREKRALAAERRIINLAGVVTTRCFLCASDMAGKVPFEYLNNRFCSIECLKAHRRQTPVVLS